MCGFSESLDSCKRHLRVCVCVCVGRAAGVFFYALAPPAGVVLQVLVLQWQKVGRVGSLTNKQGGGDR